MLVPDLNPIWKRDVNVFGVSKNNWAETGPGSDGSYTYTATSTGSVRCEWKEGKSEEDTGLPTGTVVTYWPDTGKVRIKQP